MTGSSDGTPIPEPVPAPSVPALAYDDLQRGDRIGTGGDADVYEATVSHGGTEYTLAVKQPRFEGTIQRGVVERFEEEADTWSSLDDHDNVVSVYAWDTEPLPWLALEYVDGGTLDSRLGTASLPEVLWLAGRIAEGIRHGHRHGVAHLDVKPSNVLLCDTGPETWNYPKVSDWGLAKLLLEHSNSVAGVSPSYAAPEQFDTDTFGRPDDITDIYQLGAVVYALLTGDPPFTGPSTEVMHSVLDEEPTPPSEAGAKVPKAVDQVVSKALAKRKDDRYDGMLTFRKHLDRLFEKAAGKGTTSSKADSEAPAEENDRSLPTRRGALALVGAGVVGAGGWLALSGLGGGGSPREGTSTPGGSPTGTSPTTASQTEDQSGDQSEVTTRLDVSSVVGAVDTTDREVTHVEMTVGKPPGSDDIDLRRVTALWAGPNGPARLVHESIPPSDPTTDGDVTVDANDSEGSANGSAPPSDPTTEGESPARDTDGDGTADRLGIDGRFAVSPLRDSDGSAPVLNDPGDRVVLTFDLGSGTPSTDPGLWEGLQPSDYTFGRHLQEGSEVTLELATGAGGRTTEQLVVPDSLAGAEAVEL